ncbi:MAG TPA: NAD-dependent epimerase/dehydratase family protein [Thermoleophilaceae bacterium]|nr:NAD-dependent epimerase/dehydratase family protein [Thermoleophilaceae bacterium]
MRTFVTGATGFIGAHVARKLLERGDQVVALVRSPDKASDLREQGAELIEGDLSNVDAIKRGAEGAEAVFHLGAIYKLGIPKKDREGMIDTNVGGTERVLDAAHEAGVPRIVYVSTVNVFGNTGGRVVDETYRRDESEGFLSCYDETKYRSHTVAEERIARGYPIVMVQPGGVYGPNDHSEVGNMIEQVRTGKLKAKAFPDMGIMLVYVEDVADGVLLAHDKGEIGESYVLAGEKTTMGEIVDRAAELSGRKPPRLTMPTLMIKASAPLGPLVGPALGFPPNLRELISASDGVTYWATDDKARRELGFQPRDMETGLRETLAAA